MSGIFLTMFVIPTTLVTVALWLALDIAPAARRAGDNLIAWFADSMAAPIAAAGILSMLASILYASFT